MSVYLTVVFSNKMMKGLLIVLSVRLSVFVSMSSDSETAGAVKHYERRQHAYLSM